MKLSIIGELVHVGQVQDKKDYMFQEIRIKQQLFNPKTGEPEKPEIYSATIFNKKIDELRANNLAGKKVAATCWTRSVEKEHNGDKFYNIALNCSDLIEL